MKTEIKLVDGIQSLVIVIPMQAPTPSATGKTLVVATSSGNRDSGVVVDGKPVMVGVNAYVKR